MGMIRPPPERDICISGLRCRARGVDGGGVEREREVVRKDGRGGVRRRRDLAWIPTPDGERGRTMIVTTQGLRDE